MGSGFILLVHIATPRRDPLHHGGSRGRYFPCFIGEHVQVTSNGFQKLAGTEQEVRVTGAAEALVALGEGLVQQQAARRHQADQRRQKGTVQVVRHDHRVEPSPSQRKGRTVLQVPLQELWTAWRLQVRDVAEVPVDASCPKAEGVQEPEVPSSAASKVEDCRS